ncbi:hypothetical protein HDU96_005059 [Phlyctochytrium bullatum]|nr:hypothetical protein HDU96_005059 [Phlyctochytrium bullatum]
MRLPGYIASPPLKIVINPLDPHSNTFPASNSSPWPFTRMRTLHLLILGLVLILFAAPNGAAPVARVSKISPAHDGAGSTRKGMGAHATTVRPVGGSFSSAIKNKISMLSPGIQSGSFSGGFGRFLDKAAAAALAQATAYKPVGGSFSGAINNKTPSPGTQRGGFRGLLEKIRAQANTFKSAAGSFSSAIKNKIPSPWTQSGGFGGFFKKVGARAYALRGEQIQNDNVNDGE